MDEEELHSSLETYKSQLHQVEQAIQAAGSSPDLEALRNDLTELVNLTQGSLLSLKKSQLLKEIDSRDGSGGSSDSKGNNSVKQKASLYDSEESGSTSLDNEYAAFQEMLGTDVTSSQDSAENKNNFKEKVYEGRDRCNEELDVSSGGSVNDLYKDIVGTRCQAPYAHDWGEKAYGNALIAGVETGLETEMPKFNQVREQVFSQEISGNRDMFDAMKRQEKLDRNLAKKLENQYKSGVQKTGVFDFINKKLGGKKGKLSELIHHHGDGKQSHGGQGHSKLHRNISEQDLKEKSDKNINIQLLKTSGEMKSVQKELMKLKESLSRNERDKSVTARVKTKISSLESYLEKLKSSENLMESHQQKRKNHKKMTVF
ncbi:ZGPAT-like protein [Mya arenaria]|uniref:ZGPAT-like protein n=1 Tax=Mya arenaria TaxID=6604 RepID=A0ABY7GEH2_MYAAR|nr:ZGPAT-like protein [Mya arenaria]